VGSGWGGEREKERVKKYAESRACSLDSRNELIKGARNNKPAVETRSSSARRSGSKNRRANINYWR
jgi:hypothetical protein